jgi:hypothetical protein
MDEAEICFRSWQREIECTARISCILAHLCGSRIGQHQIAFATVFGLLARFWILIVKRRVTCRGHGGDHEESCRMSANIGRTEFRSTESPPAYEAARRADDAAFDSQLGLSDVPSPPPAYSSRAPAEAGNPVPSGSRGSSFFSRLTRPFRTQSGVVLPDYDWARSHTALPRNATSEQRRDAIFYRVCNTPNCTVRGLAQNLGISEHNVREGLTAIVADDILMDYLDDIPRRSLATFPPHISLALRDKRAESRRSPAGRDSASRLISRKDARQE